MSQQSIVTTERATFGAGCFWGIEAAFRELAGVVDVAVGYEGGTMERPTYRDVCTGRTGHAEVALVTFDPARVSYDELLETFWSIHDPTTEDRQGPDRGTQYRSAIFFHSVEQRAAAAASLARQDASGRYRRPIATSVEPAQTFYRAEEYHQRYYQKHAHGVL